MSVKYRNQNGQETIIAGLTPGGNLEAGAVATRKVTSSIPATAANGTGYIDIVFDEPMPDSDYLIEINPGDARYNFRTSYLTANGFRLNYYNTSSSAISTAEAVNITVTKTYTVQHAQENAEDIATLKAVVPASASSTNQLTTKSYVDNADNALDLRLDDIEDVIPTGASISNQLVTKNETSVDSALSSTSEHAVQNKVVKAALDNKQDTLTFDNTPTAGSSNPVKSSGVKSAIDARVFSNPNLLDNPWFTVNQRGQSSYTGANAYTVDRWQLRRTSTTCTLSITDDGVIISASEATDKTVFICQYLEESFVKSLNGKAITMSVLKDDGTVVKGTVASFDYQTSVQFFNKNGFVFDYEAYNNKYDFRIMNWTQSDITIRAVKLELGSVSTLAMDTAPNYQQELAKCQRYFQRIGKLSTTGIGITVAHGLAFSSRESWMPIYLSVPMRIEPTLSITGTFSVTETDYAGRISDTDGTLRIGKVVSGANGVGSTLFNLMVWDNTNPFTKGSWYKLATAVKPEMAYIDLSADL